MRGIISKSQQTTRRQLALLLFAAMGCVTTLLSTFLAGHGMRPDQMDLRHISLISLVAGAGFIAGLIVWHMASSARRDARYAKAESAQLRRNLAAASPSGIAE